MIDFDGSTHSSTDGSLVSKACYGLCVKQDMCQKNQHTK